MTDQLIMQRLLCALLLLSGALRLLRRMLCRQQAGPALHAAAMGLYALLAACFCMTILHFTGEMLLLPSLGLLSVAAALWLCLQALPQPRGRGGVAAVAALAVWTAAVLTLTLALRRPEETNVLLRFDMLADMRRLSSVRPLTDVALNMLLFLPLGLLLPVADGEKSHAWLSVLSVALLLTAVIEGAQLLFGLGQADVEDLAANVLGAMAGWGLQKLFSRKDHTP